MKTDNSSNEQCNNKNQNNLTIDVNIKEVVLTPLSCASVVNEILKGLLYQKSQIPYPYSRLKSVVDKKRKQLENPAGRVNFSIENHFRVVSLVYDTIEETMKSIEKEFSLYEDCIKEVIILFGTTPQCPKEMFTLSITTLAKGHYEKHHLNETAKQQHKVLRKIFLSQAWMDGVDGSTACTNTYVFIKKHLRESSNNYKNTTFVPSKPLSLPPKVKHLKINLNYDDDKGSCCKNLLVFEDCGDNSNINLEKPSGSEEVQSEFWCQSKNLIKGFRDSFVNKVSVSELW